jgi:hypothetical protein
VRFAAAALLVLLAACGKKDSSAVDEAYQPWKQRNFILSQTFSGGATLDGSIEIDASRDGGGPGDWIEVAVNGNTLGRTSGSPRVSHSLKFRPGPNWIRFFSSASRLGWEFNVDARQGTRFEFTPKDKLEWTMTQVKDE